MLPVHRGLETIAASEVKRLGIRHSFDPEKSSGGFTAHMSMKDVALANLQLRTASRIILRLGAFTAKEFWDFRKKAAKLPWDHYILPDRPVHVRASSHHSDLYHQRGICERLMGAIGDKLGVEVVDSESERAQLVLVRIVKNNCMISIDTTGDHLHKRGYRTHVGRAPIRENLAAALIALSGWKKDKPLIDPCCGSGTIPIEAAMMAKGIAPGINRSFAFEDWPHYPSNLMNEARDEVAEKQTADELPMIYGCDSKSEEIEAANANAQHAGLSDAITLESRRAADITFPDEPGVIVANFPYGRRVHHAPGKKIMKELGDALEGRPGPWRMTALVQHVNVCKHKKFQVNHVTPFKNGGLNLSVVTGRWV